MSRKKLSHSLIIQRMSQQLILTLAFYKEFDIFTHDISQTYTQSNSWTFRNFYVRPQKELKLLVGTLLKVLHPLYGVPESGTPWFRIYDDHHVKKMDLMYSSCDLYLLFNSNAIIRLQIDYTIAARNSELKLKEEENFTEQILMGNQLNYCKKIIPQISTAHTYQNQNLLFLYLSKNEYRFRF